MKISQVELLVEIADAGSISQAAANLYMSQPYLSKILRDIEEEAGVQIFERGKNGIKPTPFGKKFISYARDIVAQMDVLNKMCSTQSVLMPLELSVCAEGYKFLYFILCDIYKKYKGNALNITCIESSVIKQINLINDGQAEIGIATIWGYNERAQTRRFANNGIEWHRLGKSRPGVYVGRNSRHIPEKANFVTLEMLRNMPFVTISRAMDRYVSVIDYIADLKNAEPFTKKIYVNDSGSMREMVNIADGFSIAAYCETLYEKYPFYEELRFIPFPQDYNVSCEVGWLQKSNTLRSMLANELVQRLQNAFNE